MTGLGSLRERDDVLEREEVVEVHPHELAEIRQSREAGVDEAVAAVVRDGGRVALVRNPWSDGWVIPGGKVEPGEPLDDAVVREVREETGLDATVARPLELVEQRFVADDDETRGHFAVFELRVDDARIGDGLGEDDTEIADAAWFADPTESCSDADLLARHVD